MSFTLLQVTMKSGDTTWWTARGIGRHDLLRECLFRAMEIPADKPLTIAIGPAAAEAPTVGAPKGFRDLYWCSIINEPGVAVGYRCSVCEHDVKDLEDRHTFIAHIGKPGQGAVEIPTDPLAASRAAARLLEEVCNSDVPGSSRHDRRLFGEALDAARAAARVLENLGQRLGSDAETSET